MTIQEMLSYLGLRMEDASESDFSASVKLDAMNLALYKLLNRIRPEYLLHNRRTGVQITVANSHGYMNYGGVDYPLLRDYLLSVREYSASGDQRLLRRIHPADAELWDNTYLGDAEIYQYYLTGERINVHPSTISTLKLDYICKPLPMQDINDISVDTSGNTLTFTGASNMITAASSAFSTFVDVPRPWVKIDGSAIAEGVHRISSISNTALTLDTQMGSNLPTDATQTSGTVTFSLMPPVDELLHGIIVDFAEADLWRRDNKMDRYQAAEERAVAEIEALNAQVGEQTTMEAGSV